MDEQFREALEEHKEETKRHYHKAITIIYYLLEKGQLSVDDQKALYNDYSEREVQKTVDEIAESFNVLVRRYNHVIYMIPYEDNEVMGMKMEDLRKIAGSKQTNITAYMSMYLVTLFLELFYNGVGESLKTRDYVSVEEVSALATQRLGQAASKAQIADEEEETGYNVVAIYEHWIALQEDDENHRSINTKNGYIRSVVNFLIKENLFNQYGYDNIRPTKKLTDLMGHFFLDNKRKETIERLFSEHSVLVEDEDA